MDSLEHIFINGFVEIFQKQVYAAFDADEISQKYPKFQLNCKENQLFQKIFLIISSL